MLDKLFKIAIALLIPIFLLILFLVSMDDRESGWVHPVYGTFNTEKDKSDCWSVLAGIEILYTEAAKRASLWDKANIIDDCMRKTGYGWR